jgi:hypothetical protein
VVCVGCFFPTIRGGAEYAERKYSVPVLGGASQLDREALLPARGALLPARGALLTARAKQLDRETLLPA